MAFFIQILAVSVVILVVGVGAYLGDRIRDDGYRRSTRRATRRSRPSDPFNRPSRLA